MPFGEKKHPITNREINFDDIYRRLIKPAIVGEPATADRKAIPGLGLNCLRSDEISSAGLIHRDMIDQILKSDIAIVDITTGNANVMYELGVRHAAKRWGTIILRQAGHDAIPFNISGLRAVDYDLSDDAALEHSKSLLRTNILNSLEGRSVDSLVHTLFSGLNISRRAAPKPERKIFVWSSPKAPNTKLCIVWGDHANIDMADIWVNPENTKLQMGRYHDNSISSYIRYWGAKRDSRGAVIKDNIATELWQKVGKAYTVEPGTVVLTQSGGLRHTNNVKALIHVAAQYGEPGTGYRTIRGYASGIAGVLDAADAYNRSLPCRLGLRPRANSILIPLFGTRGQQEDAQTVATNLIRTAKNYIEMWPEFSLKRIYFQAWTDQDDELCTTAFNHLKLKYESSEPE